MFDILEAQNLLGGQAEIVLMPKGNELLKQMAAMEQGAAKAKQAATT
jgi:hypothetical protein